MGLVLHTDIMEKTHDYKDTIKEAAEFEDDGKAAARREQRADAAAAYETMAMTSAMNVLGMEEQMADMLQLELAQELLYIEDPQSHNADDDLN